ncbi:MAG: hypothetical protein IJR89_04345 [Clostridia bacterium]|nr:hypothetical protein [Clostridia bacterium]
MILGFLFFAGLFDFLGAPLWLAIGLGLLLDLAVCGFTFRYEIRDFCLRAAKQRRAQRLWRIPARRSPRNTRIRGY